MTDLGTYDRTVARMTDRSGKSVNFKMTDFGLYMTGLSREWPKVLEFHESLSWAICSEQSWWSKFSFDRSAEGLGIESQRLWAKQCTQVQCLTYLRTELGRQQLQKVQKLGRIFLSDRSLAIPCCVPPLRSASPSRSDRSNWWTGPGSQYNDSRTLHPSLE
jgi:hypothetical protein